MYRYNVDNAITYTQDDLVLFRESPFAVWMERLTLENPDHGIPPDLDSFEPGDRSPRQDDIVATLRAEGRNVALIDWDLDEPGRRAATLGAMRDGADFIVNGQLAVGNLSGGTNLLMRTSGFSDLGDFLYIPCETQSRNTFQSAFRLCFAADLLLGLQGQLPPQMLIIRDGAEVVPLQTEDYIYYYQAVQQRFLQAMSNFRKHRMPDPAESSHFGRWSECACEVLKQRALAEQQRAEEHQAEKAQEAAQEELVELPHLRVASGTGAMPSHYDPEVLEQTRTNSGHHIDAAVAVPQGSAMSSRGESGATLAEQARLLAPGSFRSDTAPGHTPNLARFGRTRPIAAVADSRETQYHRRSTDDALQNLEFIGSSPAATRSDVEPVSQLVEEIRPAPAPNLRETPKKERSAADLAASPAAPRLPDLQPRTPVFLPPDKAPSFEAPAERPKPPQRPAEAANGRQRSVIDLDSAPPPTLAPVVQRAEEEFERFAQQNPAFRKLDPARPIAPPDEKSPAVSPFSSSLITSQDFNDL
jgi:hypothetical protein